MKALKTITVAELRVVLLNQLAQLDDEDLVTFGNGDLSLYRLKERGARDAKPRTFNVEFGETYRVTGEP